MYVSISPCHITTFHEFMETSSSWCLHSLLMNRILKTEDDQTWVPVTITDVFQDE